MNLMTTIPASTENDQIAGNVKSDYAKEKYKATSGRISLQEIRSMDYLRKRIKDSYIYESNSGCFLWDRGFHNDGYGRMSWHDITKRAHRLSYEAFRGYIPEGLQVCHRCDTPLMRKA